MLLQKEKLRTDAALQLADCNYQNARRVVDTLGMQVADRLFLVPGSEISKKESAGSFSKAGFRHSDLALIELASEEVSLPHEMGLSYPTESVTSLDVPVPTGMMDVGLGPGLQAIHRNLKDAKSFRKQSVDTLNNRDLRDSIMQRLSSADPIANLDRSLPIPAGMIYLDFATSLHSKPESAMLNQLPVLQAGIKPLALIQAFVNSQPVGQSVFNQENDLAEADKEESADSNTMSWSTIEMVATLSGFFFAISNRWVSKAVIAKLDQKSKRSPRLAIRRRAGQYFKVG